MRKKVCVLTAGSIASTPRMLKAADALHAEGFDVRVVHAEAVQWADEAAKKIVSSRPWGSDLVEWISTESKAKRYARSAAHRLARGWLDIAPSVSCDACAAMAGSPIARELARLVRADRPDLVYAGTPGGSAVAAWTARSLKVPYAVDVEDLHCSEKGDGSAREQANRIGDTILASVARDAVFLTTPSQLAADEILRRYGRNAIVVHNTFPLPSGEPRFSTSEDALRLFWFSQTIGPDRGLQDVIDAAELARKPICLGILGRPKSFAGEIVERASRVQGLELRIIPPMPPDELLEECSRWDVGLSLERRVPLNRDATLSNKLFTYPLAGLAVIATATTAIAEVAESFGEGLFVYELGDTRALADRIALWSSDREALLRAKKAAWRAAASRWNYDHPLEKGAVVSAVRGAISRAGSEQKDQQDGGDHQR